VRGLTTTQEYEMELRVELNSLNTKDRVSRSACFAVSGPDSSGSRIEKIACYKDLPTNDES
jgi:hypothetical protein